MTFQFIADRSGPDADAAFGATTLLIVDEDLRIVGTDDSAPSRLSNLGVEIGGDILRSPGSFAELDIRRAVASGRTVAIHADGLLVTVIPMRLADDSRLRRAALVFRALGSSSRDPVAPIAEACGLTAAETEVLRLVYKGFSTVEVAGILGIAKTTVRTHLQHVFAKTETSRQSELVHFVATFRDE